MEPQVINALLLTSVAGLSTTVGSLIGLLFKKENPKFMSFTLGFTAGVMIGVSFFELLLSLIYIFQLLWVHASSSTNTWPRMRLLYDLHASTDFFMIARSAASTSTSLSL